MIEQEYLAGGKNLAIRLYFYLSNGLGIVNEFRNLLLGIFGIYIALKLDQPLIMAALFLASVIVLIPLGWFMVHRVSKVREWLNTRYGSHYAVRNFDYVKAQHEEMVRIRELLENLNLDKN